jgi:hypothetical protein
VYWRIDIKERRYCLKELINVLRSKGMTREELEISSFTAKYLKILFGEAPWSNRDKQKNAFAAAAAELADVISEIFRSNNNFGEIDIPAPPPPQQKIFSSAAPEKTSTEKTPSQPLPEVRRFGKEVDRSLLKNMPAVENVLDEEFAKFLGVDGDE